ncbi:MAG: T9SS type A sorting domain-containing protein [Bacteroidetes bacterium]|nr:MAG: T9SS type A sorting domain-containing protein [Bacteroidota bacterium]
MKHPVTFSSSFVMSRLLRSALFTSIVLTFFIVTLIPAGQARKVASAKEKERIIRTINANEQLREYNQQAQSFSLAKKIGATTFAMKSSVHIKPNPTLQTTSNVFYYDDMESGTNGWTTQVLFNGVEDIWHQTTSSASSATHSWWAGIEGQGDYNTGSRIDAALVSPSIDLSTAVAPISLIFTEYYMTEQGWDFCMVEISFDDGSSWIPLRGLYGHAPSGNSGGWKISNISLDAFAGAIIKLRFHLDTGDPLLNAFPGWFVDDVMIYDQAGTISGRKFFDFNNNGQKETDERGLRDWLITADGPVSLTMRTNERGRFNLMLPLGTYTVTEAVQSGWTQTMPVSGSYSVDVATADTTIDGLLFGNYKAGAMITGMKFNDLNQNGVKDPEDTALADWRVNLYNSGGVQVDFDKTDSLGMYTLFVFEPGQYIVEEVEKYGWVASQPDSGRYRLSIPNLSTNFENIDFGNYYSNESNAIVGQKFHDQNMNGFKDEHEPGLPGWTIHLFGQGVANKYRITDDSGYYAFLSLGKNKTFKVEEIHQAGWCQSVPESLYVLPITMGEFYENINFGNHEIGPGSISGMKFFDRNGNAQKDSGEAGISGFTINLTGEANGTAVNATATTDGDGNYTFSGLWAGTYTLSEVFRAGWVQTYPVDLGSYFVTLGCEENTTGYDFGNLDSLYLGEYRTFKAESLALAKDLKGKHLPIPEKPTSSEFCIKFYNAETLAVEKLTIFFKVEITLSSMTSSQNASMGLFNGKKNSLVVTFASPLQPGDSVTVCGYSYKNRLQGMNKWHWTFVGGARTKNKRTSNFTKNVLRLPMPNALNAAQVVGKKMNVGLGGPHSVVFPTYKEIIKSLVEVRMNVDRMHIGEPSCLDRTTKNKLITKERKYLTPTEGQNRLFAKAIAFKINILSSQANVTTPGFGGLIYDDGTGATNPLNNLTLYQIAAKIDSFMSQATCSMLPSLGSMTANDLDELLENLNAAFSGPIDTLRFGGGVRYKPVKALTEVPFLRYDTSTTARQEWIAMDLSSEEPETFAMYQNYPNPFNPTTRLSFVIGNSSFVTLKVYNMLGQEVASLIERQDFEVGEYEIPFDGTNLPSGIYFYRINVVGQDGILSYSDVKRMTLIK